MLNFGHCFGHAIETATDYAIPHGQAVVLGIVLANLVAKKRGLLSDQNDKVVRETLLLPVIKVDLKNIKIDSQAVVLAMKQDKKRTGSGLALVIKQDNQEMVRLNDVADDEAMTALAEFKDICCK